MLARIIYNMRNWRAHFRAAVHGTVTSIERAVLAPAGMVQGRVACRGELRARIVRGEAWRASASWWQRLLDLSGRDVVLSRRVITTVGVKYLCDDFNANTKDVTNFKAHAWGTGTNAEAAADTALQTESAEARVNGTQASATVGANATYTTVATITATATRAITEHGIFDSTTVAGSTLWDRSVFSVINLASGDSIQFTYVLTANSGG